MIIYLDSIPTQLASDGARVRYASRGEVKRRYDGTLLSSVTAYRGYTRIWEMRTAEELVADIDTLQASLEVPGAVMFGGDLVASDIPVYPKKISRRIGRNAQYAILSFDLWEEAVIADDRKELIRVWVADSTDTLQNLSEWFMGASINASVEAFCKTASVSFWRETASASKAPLMGSPAPIMPGRRIEMESAIIGIDEAVEESDWQPVFIGRIDDVGWGGNSSQITVPCRDPAGRLHDAWVKTDQSYGDDVSPVPVQTVMQQILDANVPTPNTPVLHTIETATFPDFGVYAYDQGRASVQDALFALRDLPGGDLRYLWNSSDQELQLTLYEPDRDKTVPDHIFSLDDYYEISEVSLSALGVRNYIECAWHPDEQSVVVEDTSSQQEYANEAADGIYYLFLDESRNAQINSLVVAHRFASNVLAETAFPALSHTARNIFTPQIEIGDLCRYPANGVHYNTDQDVAVVGYTHEISPEGNSTTIAAAGSPRGSVTRWHLKGTKAIRDREIEDVVDDPLEFTDRVRFMYTSAYGSGYANESTADESLGGFISTTEVVGGLYGLFREVLEAEKSGGITLYRSVALINSDVGPAAREICCSIGFLSPEEGASGHYIFSIGIDPIGVVLITDSNPQSAISADEETAPDSSPAITYISPLEDGSPLLDVGTIEPGEGRIIHLKLEVLAGATGQYTDEALVIQEQTPAG